MHLDEALASLPSTLVPAELDRFRSRIDATWIEEALTATGTASLRRRRLPAEQVVWLVVGMALLRNESIDRVVAMLDLALPGRSGDRAARSGIAQARQRLGAEPIEYLFRATGAQWSRASADRHRWRGLSLWGLDGTTIRVPDSDDNRQAFGAHVGNGLRAGSAYPQIRLVALMALRSHLLAAARFDTLRKGETTLAEELWQEIPDDSLTLVDRAFAYPSLLEGLRRSGQNRHWLVRARAGATIKKVRSLGRNDDLVEISISPRTRRERPDLPAPWLVRAIRYQRKGFPPGMLLTSLLDARTHPTDELVALYHERWELEVGYDEVKTHLLAREEAIRSRTPTGVRQEMWGILLAYNLVRVEMERAADEAGVEPTRISFVNALALVRYAFLSASTEPLAPGRIPVTLLRVRADMKLLLLPPRRERSYPRVVKIKMSSYLKAPSRRGRK